MADDEPVFGLTTAQLLRRAGFTCDHVNSAEAALAYLIAHPCDVLVADIMMPGNTELHLLEKVRSLDNPPTVILVTGYPSVESAVVSLEKGVFAYKIKPFDIEDFIETVSAAARRTRLLRTVRHEIDRNQTLGQRLEDIRNLFEATTTSKNLALTVQQYVRAVLSTVIESMLDVINVLDIASVPQGEARVHKLVRHPDEEVYREAIRQTIDVLESTKSAFKSRELAELRRKLDVLLHVVGKE